MDQNMDIIWNTDMIPNETLSPSFARWGTAPALQFHQGMEGYHPTSLIALPKLAEKLNISQIWVKDESSRFGLNAFKGLGCSYAMANYLCSKANIPMDRNAFSQLCSPEIQSMLGKITFITATDGNHGRGVAWAAKLLGHQAIIYMPKGTVRERFENIQALGAEVHILPVSYDDAVRAAADAAEKNGWVLIQDTAWTGYETIPRQIMEGYTTLACEIGEQLAACGDRPPTHVFLQAGVGSMAGAVSAYFVQHWKDACPKIIIVEPDRADCHFRTINANDGRLHKITGEMNSMMAGLCCGEPNPISWKILKRCATMFISCKDECAANGMRILGKPQPGDKAIVSGESGAVTAGVLAELLNNPEYAACRKQLGLDQNSRVLLISTEGDTDQENYKRVLNTPYTDLLEQAAQYAISYVNATEQRLPFPDIKSIQDLEEFDEELPTAGTDAAAVIRSLHEIGSRGTTNVTGGRYFGFVNGGLLPVAHAAQWLADTWNQNTALYVMSPTAAKLEELCERWIVKLLGLEPGTAMGLVTGSSNALICALAAARNELLRRQGYDLSQMGLRNAPPIRVVMGAGAHSSVSAALSVLGIGQQEIEIVPIDHYGRIDVKEVPKLDAHTLLVLQAGNVCGGSFDPIDELCDLAKAVGAWVHIDGAFGLWAAASRKQRHLTAGLEKADSWSVDAHKTLNAGYDCGIVLCRNRAALTSALQANGTYIQYSVKRDGMDYTTEMSRRARGVILWAVLKQLGAEGVEKLIDQLCGYAEYFARALENAGFKLVNPVSFNQFMIKADTPEETEKLLAAVQAGGTCWCGKSQWNEETVIRISVCSHETTIQDIDKSVAALSAAQEHIKRKE